MDPITIAMGLANFAPQILKWVTGSDKAEAAATAVVDIAKKVTGLDKGDEAVEAVKASPELALQFRLAVMNNSSDLDKAYLADVADARKRSTLLAQAGMKNWRPDVMFILAIAVTSGLVWLIWKDPSINEYVKGIFTLVLGRFLGYLDNIYNFEFGSTRSNKQKDETIQNLTK